MDKKEKKYRLSYRERFKEGVADVLHTKYSLKHPESYSKQEEQSRQSQKIVRSQAVGTGYASGPDENPRLPPQRDIWIGYGAVACLLLILSGTTIMNLKNSEGNLNSRDLSSEEEAETQQMEEEILNDLKIGRRELSSVNGKTLLKKEQFEHEILKNYLIVFDHQGWVSEIQLKPENSPIYINDISQFIKENSDFFPPLRSHPEELQDEMMKIYHFRNKSGKMIFAFRMNQENKLLSMVMESTDR